MPAAHARMAKLVVTLALLLIPQNLISLGALLKCGLGFGLVFVVPIRVIFHRQPAVGAFDLLAIGGLSDTQHFVIISFYACHVHPTSTGIGQFGGRSPITRPAKKKEQTAGGVRKAERSDSSLPAAYCPLPTLIIFVPLCLG